MRIVALSLCTAGYVSVARAFPQQYGWYPPATYVTPQTTSTPVSTAYEPTSTALQPTSTAYTSTPTSYTSLPATNDGLVRFAGLNIAGFDLGVRIWGNRVASEFVNIAVGNQEVPSGFYQMQHFVQDDGLNAFRLPVAWQYLVNGVLGGKLDPANIGAYDQLVQDCVRAEAKMCIVDVHNYARWDGKIVGQSGSGYGSVTNAHFASLWWQLAVKYKSQPQVAFDLMNEPHDLDMDAWATTTQWAVNAIRNAGAKDNFILLSGTDYAAAGSFVSQSANALSRVTDPRPGGGTDRLIFNVHQYLDGDHTGTSPECVRNNVDAFQSLAAWLRANGRKAMLTETGGGRDNQDCKKFLCQQMDAINANSDVYFGVVTWAAGAFGNWYDITETPMKNAAGQWEDQELVNQCVVGKFRGVTG